MNIPQTVMRGGNDPPLSWTFTNEDGVVVPLPDLFEVWIQPQGSARIEATSAGNGRLAIDRAAGTVTLALTVAEAQGLAKGTGAYALWGETAGRRRMWAGGDFIVDGVI